MPESSFPYPEQILQWIWNEQLFDTENLLTQCGKQIRILNQGTLNSSDGPDFKQSKILIDDLEWNGSVELHITSNGWRQHGHHTDENYNNVILHVVTESNPIPILTKSESSPFTLNLLPHLPSDLEIFLKNIKSSSHLPCVKNLNFISEEVFNAQIEKAHIEYLDKKVNDFIGFYSPEISQSLAWKHALVISIFDGFGISRNRLPMRQLARQLLSINYTSSNELSRKAKEIAFGLDSDFKWSLKGNRPYSHPSNRIETAIQFMDIVLRTPFEDFLSTDALHLWASWCKKIGIHKAGHPKILFATVYLPALYFLGNMYQSKSLIDTVKDQWNTYQAPIPTILLFKFNKLDIPSSTYRNKLGAVHQLKHYCASKKCSECLVLKNAISS